MIKKSKIIGALLLCTAFIKIETKMGCMVASTYLTQAYDPKALHYIPCTCHCNPVDRVDYGKLCLECGHTHGAKTFEILPQSATGNGKRYKGSLASYPTVQEALRWQIAQVKRPTKK